MVVFGDKAIEHVFKHINDGDEVDWYKVNPSGIRGKILREVFYRLEKFRRWKTGYW